MDDENIETNEEVSTEKKVETNEVTSSTTNSNQNTEPQGNWFSRQSTPVKVILGIVAVCCIAIIVLAIVGALIPGGINYEFGTNLATFPQETTIQGVVFHLPDGYDLVQSDTTNLEYKSYSYVKGTDEISITAYPTSTKSEILSNVQNNPNFFSIGEASFGGVSGYTAKYNSGTATKKIFLFEKSGTAFLIEMSNVDDFSEYIPKIIG